MIRKVLIIFMLVSYVVSDSCVRYTFEEDFNELFTPQRGYCGAGDKFWVVGKYTDINLTNENDQRTTFITPVPLPAESCASSFSFPVAPGGTIEVNIFIETSTGPDQIWVAAYHLEQILGQAGIWSGQHNFVHGWHTLKIILPASAIDGVYISFLGWASPNSTVLIDSFRYIPPGMEESACRLYEDEPEPMPPTLKPTTPYSTTPEETSPYSTTLEETTFKPTTPEVTTSEPTTPEETTPDPTTPEVTTPEPITPEETTPEPTTPEPENNYRYLLSVETWIKTQLSTSSKTM